MLSSSDFAKKQIVFVFFSQGEKLSFLNDNFVVRDSEGKVKFQCTCYRLFLVFAIGHGSITSGLIQRSKKFGFSIVLMSPSMRPYQVIGASLDGNTVLRRVQYSYSELGLARHITSNKISNQCIQLQKLRNRNDKQNEAIQLLKSYANAASSAASLQELMGYEGSAARVYFPAFFNNVIWTRRAPRTKCDMINAVLDIGYTVLFSFIEALLGCYGFDLYCGVLHQSFYMRKSLVCDLVEPFRVLIDAQVRKAINLKQCKETDFLIENGRYTLKWEKNAEYIGWLARPLMDNKVEIHAYIQTYYRSFMKQKPAEDFPVFNLGDVT